MLPLATFLGQVRGKPIVTCRSGKPLRTSPLGLVLLASLRLRLLVLGLGGLFLLGRLACGLFCQSTLRLGSLGRLGLIGPRWRLALGLGRLAGLAFRLRGKSLAFLGAALGLDRIG